MMHSFAIETSLNFTLILNMTSDGIYKRVRRRWNLGRQRLGHGNHHKTRCDGRSCYSAYYEDRHRRYVRFCLISLSKKIVSLTLFLPLVSPEPMLLSVRSDGSILGFRSFTVPFLPTVSLSACFPLHIFLLTDETYVLGILLRWCICYTSKHSDRR